MKKIIISLIFVILLTSIVSAEIIINQQPKDLYNLEDIINIPIKIATSVNINNFFSMNLICNGKQTEIHKEYIVLSSGQEKQINPSVPLIKEFIGRSTGTCKIKSILGDEYVLTSEFKISDLIKINLKSEKIEFSPEENIIIEGEAIKENQELAAGFIELKMISGNSSTIEILDTVASGYFYINFSLPKDTKAGQHLVKLNIYEKDLEGEITNKGFVDYNILITQIPTNLEIFFENSEVEPGTNLKVKAILHDQTGEKIESNAIITVKDNDNTILEQTEKPTDEFLEFSIAYNEPPEEWTIVAVSNKLTSESTFKIKEKEEVKVELINKTITITNIGNVLYNKTVSVKIGNESLSIDVLLDVDESTKYILTAPDGEYQVEITTDEGNKITGMTTLTGKATSIKKAPTGVMSFVKYPVVWIFIIAILGFVSFIIFKKGYKRSFFGYISKKKEKNKATPLRKNSIVNIKNKAEISLSIKGDKQNASMVCLKIKNLKEIESKKSNTKESLQKIVDMAEENKAVIYENQDNLFFILAPIKTKTFTNERTVIKIAQKAKKILTEHNKLSKQKIEFGISLNYGAIIAKQEKEALKFMSMGTLITMAKKISSLSNQEIFLSEKIRERLISDVKTEKHMKGKIAVYTIKEIKDKEKNKKFIRSFLDRIEGKK